MSEENTTNLTQDEKLDLILAEMRTMNARLTALESRQTSLEAKVDNIDVRLTSLGEKVDERLHDTRPLWQAIHAQTEKIVEQQAEMATTLRLIDKKVHRTNYDVLGFRAEWDLLEERVVALEQRPV